MRIGVVLLLLVGFLLAVAPASADEQAITGPSVSAVSWEQLEDDLSVTRVRGSDASLLTWQLLLVRSSLSKFHVQVLRAAQFGNRRMDVKRMCRESGAATCINANFFDEKGNPLGLVISHGVVYQKMHNGGRTLTGVFEVTRNALKILSRSSFDMGNALEAVQAGPRLVAGGALVSGLKESEAGRRAGVCIDRESRVILYAVESDLVGLSLDNLQNILLRPGIDCVEALNLDGGGSAQFYISPKKNGDQETWIPGRDLVPVALALVPNL